jgi:hypothetical protein
MVSIALNVIGLVVGIIAALLMFFYPWRGVSYTAKGEAEVKWLANGAEKNIARGKTQIFLSKAAPWLLALGFMLQLASVFVALCEK